MLIRSQDREKLIDFSGCAISINIENEVIIYGNNQPDEVTCDRIGFYSSRERAVEVLDMVASAYTRNQSGNTYFDSVFDMPED